MTTWEFADRRFDPASGELTGPDGAVERLQPQPAMVLELLLERAGDVVHRDEIVERVWGDTKVEFDQAVNYAIRQIRAALGESATDPRYLETLPRRGYRILVAVRRIGSGAGDPALVGEPGPVGETGPDSADGTKKSWGQASRSLRIALVLVVGGAGWWAGQRPRRAADAGADADAPLVAVQILRHDTTTTGRADGLRVAEDVTAALTRAAGDRLRVVGPATTVAYGTDRAGYVRLRSETGASFVVGGSVDGASSEGVFVELIDARDGAHLWAMRFDPADPDVADQAADSVVARLAGSPGG